MPAIRRDMMTLPRVPAILVRGQGRFECLAFLRKAAKGTTNNVRISKKKVTNEMGPCGRHLE
jgi:hypothetical protein